VKYSKVYQSVQGYTSLTQPCYGTLQSVLLLLFLCRGRGAVYCDQFVCLSVCLFVCVCVWPSAGISLDPLDRSSRNLLYRLPVVLAWSSWHHCNSLCTSIFMDDVMFLRNGAYGDAWKAHL